ncbi:wd40/yvtn repeat-like-containing domain [Anaeramoeba ignava]|uniref:Wd40/yvtn repeat-like-containing domain n=1 Tax=Anaeramoeba ignava TaxID=1746090 RepID=A0A9Q0L699_ANAIG|nr:wd40/yvtn repeat-like-containing domain [Anaeramoeba ignava]
MSQKKQKEQQLKPIKEFTGHSREIRCLLITSDSLYSGSYDQTIKKWDLKTGKCLWTSNAKSYLFSLASYQDIIFVCGYQIYGFLKKNGNLQIEYPTVFSQYFFTICIHDHQLFAGNQDNFLRIFLIVSLQFKTQNNYNKIYNKIYNYIYIYIYN